MGELRYSSTILDLGTRWRGMVPPKYRALSNLHNFTTANATLFIVTNVRATMQHKYCFYIFMEYSNTKLYRDYVFY
jgi:hypothetical protein